MIVDQGVALLLSQQLSYLATLQWGLFTNNLTVVETTVFGDLVEATWAGYGRTTVGGWTAPTLVTPRQQTSPSSNPSFTNTSGSTQTFFGWFLFDPAAGELVAAANLGSQSIPNGSLFTLTPLVTDREE